jgi:hypothetical protein
MEFRFEDALPVLARTPAVVGALLADMPDAWTAAAVGPGTWSPFDIVGHLIHAERTNWIPRVEHLLAHGDSLPFPPFDREAMFAAWGGRTLGELLETFDRTRRASLERLAELGLGEPDLMRPGRHPALGSVTLGQLLAAWVVHDLTHLSQTVRVMAGQYADAVGPWRAYLSVLRGR